MCRLRRMSMFHSHLENSPLRWSWGKVSSSWNPAVSPHGLLWNGYIRTPHDIVFLYAWLWPVSLIKKDSQWRSPTFFSDISIQLWESSGSPWFGQGGSAPASSPCSSPLPRLTPPIPLKHYQLDTTQRTLVYPLIHVSPRWRWEAVRRDTLQNWPFPCCQRAPWSRSRYATKIGVRQWNCHISYGNTASFRAYSFVSCTHIWATPIAVCRVD